MFKNKLVAVQLIVVFLFLSNNSMCQDTTIVGKAGNAKYGAVIVCSNNEVYYFDSQKSWGSSFLDKQVQVIGEISVKKMRKIKSGYAGITGSYIRIIKRVRFKIIKN